MWCLVEALASGLSNTVPRGSGQFSVGSLTAEIITQFASIYVTCRRFGAITVLRFVFYVTNRTL